MKNKHRVSQVVSKLSAHGRLAQFLPRQMEKRAVRQPAGIAIPCLCCGDNVFSEDDAASFSVFLRKVRGLARLRSLQRTIKSLNQNPNGLGVKLPVRILLDKVPHPSPPVIIKPASGVLCNAVTECKLGLLDRCGLAHQRASIRDRTCSALSATRRPLR